MFDKICKFLTESFSADFATWLLSERITLTYPNCCRVCAFGIVRLTPGGNGNVNPEAVMGVVMQFDSPENRYAQAQENLSNTNLM